IRSSPSISSFKPLRRIASRCAPRATRLTSAPARASSTPRYPPVAPEPKMHTFMIDLSRRGGFLDRRTAARHVGLRRLRRIAGAYPSGGFRQARRGLRLERGCARIAVPRLGGGHAPPELYGDSGVAHRHLRAGQRAEQHQLVDLAQMADPEGLAGELRQPDP